MGKPLIRAELNDCITSKTGIKLGAMSDVLRDFLLEPATIDVVSGATQ
jgi:hypothetical protein